MKICSQGMRHPRQFLRFTRVDDLDTDELKQSCP